MLRFFRRIRQALIRDNKFRKYTTYALGEIALVMIGILLALQVNNWNEGRKERAIENAFLIDLKDEIAINKKELSKQINSAETKVNAAKSIAKEITATSKSMTEEQLAKLTQTAFMGVPHFVAKNSVINEIESLGGLQIIQNDTIKDFVSSWHQQLSLLKSQEEAVIMYRQKNTEIMIEDGNMKLFFDKTGFSDDLALQIGHNDHGSLHLLSFRTYENNLMLFIATATLLKRYHYEPMMEQLEKISNIIYREVN